MRQFALVIGVPMALLGLFWTATGWFGPQIGDGFTNIGRIVLGAPALLIGVVLVLVGLGGDSTPRLADAIESEDRQPPE